jgi:hypothetical protein
MVRCVWVGIVLERKEEGGVVLFFLVFILFYSFLFFFILFGEKMENRLSGELSSGEGHCNCSKLLLLAFSR